MKKLLALLLSFVVITTACASCGKEEAKEKETTPESVTVSEVKNDKEDKEESDKAESTDEGENSDKDESSEESASAETASICGGWTNADLLGAVLYFSEDGKLKTTFDYSEMMCFKDGTLEVMGQKCDTTFDGSKIEAGMGGTLVLALERTGAKDDSTMDGEYVMCEGMENSGFSALGDGQIVFVIEGNKLSVSAEMAEYTADGKMLVLKGGSILSSDTDAADENAEESCEYLIEGDTLILKNDAGENLELTRVK